MDQQERQRQIERMKQADFWEQIDAAWTLARSGDPISGAVVLEVLEQPNRYHPEVISNVIDGLVEAAPTTLELVLTYLKQSPCTQGGRDCAYILGEIAYRQGIKRDLRIVPALLQALQIYLTEGSRSASSAVVALRECARFTPLPEVEFDIIALLTIAQREKTPYAWTIENALEVLYVNQGKELLPELRARLQSIPPDHGLAIAIEEFLATKEN